MKILLNIRKIRNKTTIQNIFNMWTSSPKWGRGTIWLTIAWIIYLQKWDEKHFAKGSSKMHDFSNYIVCFFHYSLLTILNNIQWIQRIVMKALDTEFQWIWLSIWGERGISLPSDVPDTFEMRCLKLNLWIPAFLFFFNSLSKSKFSFSFQFAARGATTALDPRKNPINQAT